MIRLDGRASDELREVQITPGFMEFAEGSALIRMGHTVVVCAATVDERVPAFLRGEGSLFPWKERMAMATNATTSQKEEKPKTKNIHPERWAPTVPKRLCAASDRPVLIAKTGSAGW